MAIYRDGFEARPAAEFAARQRAPRWRRGAAAAAAAIEKIVYRPMRRKLPDERQAITHKFSIGGHEGYITVGLYRRRQPGEILHHHGQGRLDHLRA